MKTSIFLKLSRLFLAILLALTFFECTDSNLQSEGTEDPDSENPIDENPMDDPQISDNPVLRLNSGGMEIAYGDTVFTADNFFTDDSEGFENLAIEEILETDMDSIYLSERISLANLGNFEYNIPITNGTYKLKLHFAEIFWGAPDGGVGNPNSRVFDVDIEDAVKLNDYDIYNEVGAVTAVVEEFVVTIEDQELNIKFSASVDRPKVSAIEVLGDGQILSTDD